MVIVIFMPDGFVPDFAAGGAMVQAITPALESAASERFGRLPAMERLRAGREPGERRLIIGPNGAGKTTLL